LNNQAHWPIVAPRALARPRGNQDSKVRTALIAVMMIFSFTGTAFSWTLKDTPSRMDRQAVNYFPSRPFRLNTVFLLGWRHFHLANTAISMTSPVYANIIAAFTEKQVNAVSEHTPDVSTFQGLILALQQFWARQGCVILQPLDMEVGAGTFHPATFLRAVGPETWN